MKKTQTDSEGKTGLSFDQDSKYTVEQVAKHLQKSTKTVRALIKKRKLRAYQFGKRFVITASQLNEFAETQLLEKWLPGSRSEHDLAELDPAYEPPVEVALESLTDEELLAAGLVPESNRIPESLVELIDLMGLADLEA